MALSLQLNSKTYRSIVLDTVGRSGAPYDSALVQVSTRDDFNFVLAPLYAINFDGSNRLTLANLPQGQTLFIRAKERRSDTLALTGPWTNTLQVYLPLNTVRSTTPQSLMVLPAMIVPPEKVTWAATNVDTARPAINLTTDSPLEQCWFNGGILDFDTAGQPIDTVALLSTNLPNGATWQLEAYTTAANRTAGVGSAAFTTGYSQFHASADLPGRPSYHGLIRLAASRTEQFWRLRFAGDTPPASLYVATFAAVGLARVTKTVAQDKGESATDYGSLERTRDGIPDRRAGFRGRRVEFEIPLATEAQWETQYSDLGDLVGLIDPVLAVPNPRTGAFLHDRILYGPLSQQKVTQAYTPRFTTAFAIDSLI